MNKQILEKDKVIDTLKKTICANEILIQTEKDKVDSAREELRNFKQEIEHWYPGICVNVDFANQCSKSYRIKDEIIRQLLNGKKLYVLDNSNLWARKSHSNSIMQCSPLKQ